MAESGVSISGAVTPSDQSGRQNGETTAAEVHESALRASQVPPVGKNLPGCKRRRSDPWVGKIPWRRAQQPTPVFWPGESHEQRCPAGYSPWGHKESDMVEAT